jgi:hypothetical protein
MVDPMKRAHETKIPSQILPSPSDIDQTQYQDKSEGGGGGGCRQKVEVVPPLPSRDTCI